MKIETITLLFSFMFIFLTGKAQNIESWIEENEKVPVEKIYIHTDAEYYFQGDTLWFKVYLTDSRSGKLIPGAENVYINLVDENGNVVQQMALLSANGMAFGGMDIPPFTRPGKYFLQAFTDYLLNFGESAWFLKPVSISRISGLQPIRNSTGPDKLVAEVTFFPEGGILLENVTNLVAFKAINKAGIGVDVSGSVTDEQGNLIAKFKTDYKGMGLFFINPKPGKKYIAEINGLPAFRYEFKPKSENLKIQLVNHTKNEIILNIASNSEKFSNKNLYLAGMYRGEVIFYQSFNMEGLNQLIKYESKNLKMGINRLVLLSENLTPISERLLFSNQFEINRIQLHTDSLIHKRTETSVSLKNRHASLNQTAHVSVSVLHQSALGEQGKSDNILSRFLIDSELNGFFESSSHFFNDDIISSEAKLRLLMLTNGWSSYFWNTVPSQTEQLSYKQTAGLNISGKATNLLTEEPLANGEITMAIQKDNELAFMSQPTDSLGNFVFPGLLFNDTANVHVQAKSSRGSLNTDIEIFSPLKHPILTDSTLNFLDDNLNVPFELQTLRYKTNTGNNRIIRRRNNSNQNKNENSDGHIRIYESADFVVDIEDQEESFENILDYLVGKVPGLDISSEEVRIRGTSSMGTGSTPLFLIDGIPLISNTPFLLPDAARITTENNLAEEQDRSIISAVKAIPVNDIDKVEILKSAQNLAAFGANGANGVIAIYTRIGKNETEKKLAKGIIEQQIRGYSPQRTFYSPKYTPETIKTNKPDYRTTLYWNPNVTVRNGGIKLNFFTSDQSGLYQIFVEGISENGRICLGKARFEVLEK